MDRLALPETDGVAIGLRLFIDFLGAAGGGGDRAIVRLVVEPAVADRRRR